MHSFSMCCKILCQNLLVHPKCMLGGSTKFHPFHEGGGEGGSRNLMPSSNLLKSKIPMLRVGGNSQNLMLGSNLLKSKIAMLRVGGWGGLTEFDAEFKFAKIQHCHVKGGWVGVGPHRI